MHDDKRASSGPSRRRRGTLGETLALGLLQLEGLEVLARNVRAAGVEVDLVARHDTCLVLVEVKLRRPGLLDAEQALGRPQCARLRRAAAFLLSRCDWAETVRVDLVAITWHPGQLQLAHLRGVG